MSALHPGTAVLSLLLKISQPNLFIGQMSGQQRTGICDDVGDEMRSVSERFEVTCDGRTGIEFLRWVWFAVFDVVHKSQFTFINAQFECQDPMIVG